MSGRRIKGIRSEANKAVKTVEPAISAALRNEQVTRERVDKLEAWAIATSAIINRGFWGRLRWLVTGR